MSEIKFSVLENRAILKVIGEDARGFLQGLVSNDLMEASPQNTIYAALLTPQGKYLHDFFITQSGDAFLLDCEADRIDDLYKRLRLYKLGAKIDLELDSKNSIVAVIGDQAPEALGIAPLAGSTISYLNGLAFVDPRLPKMGVRMVPASETAKEELSNTGFIEVEFSDYDKLRISLGLPDGSRDMEVEKSILLEYGFEELNGVSFDKGCYTGQELTARTKHRGLVKKRLLPVTFDGSPPKPGTEIILNGKNAGEMRSAQDGMGLALIRLEALAGDEDLSSGGTILRPIRPDWAVL